VEIGMNKSAPDFRITTGLTLLFKPWHWSAYLLALKS
jgi:hypothetical protein